MPLALKEIFSWFRPPDPPHGSVDSRLNRSLVTFLLIYIGFGEENDPSANQKALLALLRQMRIEAGLRQSDMAEGLGKDQTFISKYETGERRLDILELREICEGLGISLVEFVMRLEKSLRG